MSGAAAAAAYQAAVNNAIKACGSIVRLEREDFEKLLRKIEEPIVVTTSGGVFSTHYKYLTPYKGLTFYCKSGTEIRLSSKIEVIHAKKIAIPDL